MKSSTSAKGVKKAASKKGSAKKTSKPSKMSIAVFLMEDLFVKQGLERKDILPVLMKKARLSKPAAATYYQTIKNRIRDDEA